MITETVARRKSDTATSHDWSRVASGINLFPIIPPRISIVCAGGPAYDLTVGVVAQIIGELFGLFRGGAQISTADEALVADMVKAVFSHRLFARWTDGSYQEGDLFAIIERVMLDRNHPGLATLLAQRFPAQSRHAENMTVRVIRRNGDVVPWLSAKVEISIRKALNSVGLEGSHAKFAAKVAEAVADAVRASEVPYIQVDEIQDIVERTMVDVWTRSAERDVNVFCAIKSYIMYRADRQATRSQDGDEQASQAETAPAADFGPELQVESISVKEPDGGTTLWDGEELRARIRFAATGLDLNMSLAEIEAALRASFSDGMSRGDIAVTVNLNAKTLIERDADFARFAGRIQLTYIYEEVLGWDILRDGPAKLREFHTRYFAGYVKHAVAIKRLSPRLLNYDLGKLANALQPANDMDFDFLGVQTLYDRYLIVDKTGTTKRRIETPQVFWMRVAMGLFLDDKLGEQGVLDYYTLVSTRRFCPSTPTLFNSGTLHSQLSSCYLYFVSDDLGSIFQRGIAENAQLAKWAGGLGGSWTAVRGTGAYIAGTNGEAQGVIPFLKIHNDQLVAVNQGGKRKGSGCAYLETWHVDILEFLELRKNVGDDRRRTHDMNTANWIPDLFMQRMEARKDWTLFRSNEVPDLHETYGSEFEQRYIAYEKLAAEGKIFGQKIEAIELWKKMLSMLFETGHPWITFKDACNVRSPQDHVGVIHSSNLCTEITLNTSKEETAVCNLGSVIVSAHLTPDGAIDHAKLRETVRLGLRGLDNVIDLNFYPTEAARVSNMRHRPIGMGVMGLADALYARGHSFASDEALAFNDEFMEAIAFYAYEASSDLAAERGSYSSYRGSKWDRGIFPQDTIELLAKARKEEVSVPCGGKLDWAPLRAKVAKQGMRNSNCLAIAPTATISNITGCTPCIEPTYKNLFVKSNLSGEFVVLNPYLVRDLKARNLWTPELRDQLKFHDGDLGPIAAISADLKAKYLTAFDIDPQWIIDAAARRQKWIDQAQSVNLWIKTPDLKTLSHMYRHAWHAGLKTTYYLRSLGASSIEKATVGVKKEIRGVVAETQTTGAAGKRTYSAEEKRACSIDALRRGETCEACT